MATIQEALAVVKSNSSRTGSLIALFDAKKAELIAALANQMTPEIQAAIDEVFTVETADATAIDTALNANAPPPA
jgi:chromosome segregation ATPase